MCWGVIKDVEKFSRNNLAVELMFASTKFRPAKLMSVTRATLALALLSGLLFIALPPAYAQTETVLHSFGNQFSGDGYYPFAGLVMDKEGNLYGTTVYGGTGSGGTVFKVTSSGIETVLHSFVYFSGDGVEPIAGLIMDKEGNLYGTTYQGGANNVGTVFKLTPEGTETVLYSFGTQSGDGTYPSASLMRDKKGNLYGTTAYGGANDCFEKGCGTVFKLTPGGKETVLYSFGSQSGDGIQPLAGLVMDKKGNLYGTTLEGGSVGLGTVFKLTPHGTETVLHSFGSEGDGSLPLGNLLTDKLGNLYGTTASGGSIGNTGGTVFEVTPAGTESLLYSFDSSRSWEGLMPSGGVIMDKEGNFYGATEQGGTKNWGAVFELTPAGSETPLYSFGSESDDGFEPIGGLIRDKKGNLYGTTYEGGVNNDGTVYKVTP